mgnify:CR=1 FL=1
MISTKKNTRGHFHKALYFVTLLFSVGCGSKVTYVNGDLPDFTPNGFAFHHHALALIELTKPVPIWEICREGFSRIDSREIPIATYLITNMTRGIYTPTLTYVQCKSSKAYLLQIDENGAVSKIAPTQPTNGPS